ncbi:hypothetical protein DFJ73DRAFT_961727 [Zopfochytrium polystomum]|nr:hypothetical protein DFJ73DRAFT_961727 [Zopfochytrium polystomum]
MDPALLSAKDRKALRIARRKVDRERQSDPVQLAAPGGHRRRASASESAAATATTPSPAAAAAPEDEDERLQRWQGDGTTRIDRFDVRALLDHLHPSQVGPPVNLDPADDWTVRRGDGPGADGFGGRGDDERNGWESEEEERMLNFERYRDLVEHEWMARTEESVIAQVDEEWNELILKKRQPARKPEEHEKLGGARIGFDYGTTVVESSTAVEIQSEPPRDILADIFDMPDAQFDELNLVGEKYHIRKAGRQFEDARREMDELERRQESKTAATTGKNQKRKSRQRTPPRRQLANLRPRNSQQRTYSSPSRGSEDEDSSSSDSKGDKEEFIVEVSNGDGQTAVGISSEPSSSTSFDLLPVLPRIVGVPQKANILTLTKNIRRSEEDILDLAPSIVYTAAAPVGTRAVEAVKPAGQPTSAEPVDGDIKFSFRKKRKAEPAPSEAKPAPVANASNAPASEPEKKLTASERLKLKAKMALDRSIRAGERKDIQKEIQQEKQQAARMAQLAPSQKKTGGGSGSGSGSWQPSAGDRRGRSRSSSRDSMGRDKRRRVRPRSTSLPRPTAPVAAAAPPPMAAAPPAATAAPAAPTTTTQQPLAASLHPQLALHRLPPPRRPATPQLRQLETRCSAARLQQQQQKTATAANGPPRASGFGDGGTRPQRVAGGGRDDRRPLNDLQEGARRE